MRLGRLAARRGIAAWARSAGLGALPASARRGRRVTTRPDLHHALRDGPTITAGPVNVERARSAAPAATSTRSRSSSGGPTRSPGGPRAPPPRPATTSCPPPPALVRTPGAYTADLVANGQYTVVVTATTDDGRARRRTDARHSRGVRPGRPPRRPPPNLTDTRQKSDAHGVHPQLDGQPGAGPHRLRDLPGRARPATTRYGDQRRPRAGDDLHRHRSGSTSRPGPTATSIVAVRPNGAGSGRASTLGAVGRVPTPSSRHRRRRRRPTTVGTGLDRACPGLGDRSAAPAAARVPAGRLRRTRSFPAANAPVRLPGPASARPDATTATTAAARSRASTASCRTSPRPASRRSRCPAPTSVGSAAGGGPWRHARTAEFVAAALLLAVLAMFGTAAQRAADQSPALEASHRRLPPDAAAVEPAAGCRIGTRRRRARLAPVAIIGDAASGAGRARRRAGR